MSYSQKNSQTSDRDFGFACEDWIAPKLAKAHGWTSHKIQFRDKAYPEWDILGTKEDGSVEKIEVKGDRSQVRTGNFLIEVRSKGRLSGIHTSEAEWQYIMAATGNTLSDISVHRIQKVPTKKLHWLVENGRPITVLRNNEVFIFPERLIAKQEVTLDCMPKEHESVESPTH